MLAYGFESQKWTQFTHPTKSIFDHFILVLAFLLYERGQRELPVNNVYRLLYQKELYLHAYGKLYRN